MKKLDGKSMDIVADNIAKLKEIFPDIFTEGKIDFEALRATLGNYVERDDERYSFTWNGKAKARRIAQTPSRGTLRPAKEESKDWDTTQNLYIEGDNLEVLKLLQKSYHKQVKMIYIDPPYNTGKDFVYRDNFKDNIKNYLEQTGQIDSEGKKLSTNRETSGRYHSDWLNMMYPRLKLARNLLKDDGVIFISIDDNEVANLRKICDEIFGEENFLANFLWKKKGTTSNVKGVEVSAQVDSTLCYKKTQIQSIKQRITSKETRNYPYSDEEGNYRLTVIEKKDSGSYKRDTMKFEILGHKPREGKRWQIGIETARELELKNRFIFDGEKIKLKIYDFEENNTYSAQPNLLDSHGSTDSAAKLVNKELFNIPELFDNPKPLELLCHIVNISISKNDIVLDFFSGSSTTAHAVMKLNSEDSGERRYILVQLPEPTDPKSEAYKAGYKNICEIGKERIRRAGEKIKEENKDKENIENLDIGFKVFKLDSSNIKEWDPNYENIEQSLLERVDNIKDDRTEDDLLYEILLKYGLDLTLPIEELELAGKKVYVVGLGSLVICLDEEITLDTVEEIAKLKEKYGADDLMRVVFRDNGFKNTEVKTNTIQILKQFGIDDVKSL